jgi:MFS family permease
MVKPNSSQVGPRVFQAFGSINYRLYFFGQSLSLIGTWMQRTAVYWLIFELTQSAFILGVTAFCAQFPSFLFSILGGVVSDRYNRFNVLLATQVASLVQAVILTVLVYSGAHEVWQILALSVLLGCINAFDVPARQALVYDMIDNKEHLPNAIALNSSMVNIARLVGPAIAGLVLEKFGAEMCFASNAFSFVAVIISLLFMKLPPFQQKERITTVRQDLSEGLSYLKMTPGIRKIIIMLACVSFLSLPYVTLLPVFADNILHGSALTFGLLNTFVGFGAVTGALFLASLKTGTNLKVVLFRCTLLFGIGLMSFAYMQSIYPALLCMAVVGFGMMAQTTISNTIIQTTVAPAMRGRVISFYAMAFFGMQPVGGLLVGAIAHATGAQFTILCQGIATLLIAVVFFPFLRRDILLRKQRMKLKQVEEQIVENT